MIKRTLFIILLLVLAFTIMSCGEKDDDTPLQGDLTGLAKEYISKLGTGDFDDADTYHNADMRQALPGNKLAETWQSIEAQFGSYQNIERTRTGEVQGFDLVFVTVNFSKAEVEFRVVFDDDQRIAGFHIESVADPLADLYTPPDYAQLGRFTEEEVTVGSGEWALPGTLTLPTDTGRHFAVILVHGSGPNDRDETIGPNKPFKDLAWGLASEGIAVLRYDKRTLVHGQSMDIDTTTLQEETIDDALLAVDLLKNHPQIDPANIFVLGHSLGAMAAPRIGEANSQLAGLILLAGATRPLEDVILEQVTYLTSLDPSPEGEAELAAVEEQVAKVKESTLSLDTPAAELPLGISPAYWLDLQNYNPAQTAQSLEMPILVLHGQRDYQVSMEDFAGWQQALAPRPNVKLTSYPDLNHLFMTGEGRSTPEEYANPGNVAQVVVEDIASWLRSQQK